MHLCHIEARPVSVAKIGVVICITLHVLESLGGRVLPIEIELTLHL